MRFLFKPLFIFILLIVTLNSWGQEKNKKYNPFEAIGKKGEIVTAYGDRFVEVFDTDSIQRIGSVLFHIYEKKVIRLLNPDSVFTKVSDNSSASRWYQVDPLAGSMSSWSPYNFAFDNPIRYNDPDGRAPFADYYNQKGQRIGTDGVDDGRVYVVTNKKEAETIKATNKAGGTTEVSSVSSAVQLPSAFVRSEMGLAVDRMGQRNDNRNDVFKGNDDEGGFHEEGGVYGPTRDGTMAVVHAKPGAKADPMADAMATVAPGVAADPSQADLLPRPEGSFHVHPSGTRGGGSNSLGPKGSFNPEPTPGVDYNEASGYRGNSYVLSPSNGTVYIINKTSSTPVATFPLKQFLSIGNK